MLNVSFSTCILANWNLVADCEHSHLELRNLGNYQHIAVNLNGFFFFFFSHPPILFKAVIATPQPFI